MANVIIYEQDSGIVAVVHPTQEALDTIGIDAIREKSVPSNKQFRIIDSSDIPADRIFRQAWEFQNSGPVHVNMGKAKAIAHDKRRASRDTELLPFDRQATIPQQAAASEDARKVIRKKYDEMQIAIDSATTPEAIKAAML